MIRTGSSDSAWSGGPSGWRGLYSWRSGYENSYPNGVKVIGFRLMKRFR
jgi:hypothetical protein